MKRFVFGIFCFISIFCFSSTDSFSKTSSVTVYRDDYGVPHIFSQDIEGPRIVVLF